MDPDLLTYLLSRAAMEAEWCPPAKVWGLASLVIALRPRTIVEIGVWTGGSLLPMAIAAKVVGGCTVHAIDAWDPAASAEEQIPINAEWWSTAPHDWAYDTFMGKLHQYGVEDVVRVQRARSCDATLPPSIDLVHLDGNHGPQAYRDVGRLAPLVAKGGIFVLDDINWDGGHVRHAANVLGRMGFRQLYELGTGAVFQQVGQCPTCADTGRTGNGNNDWPCDCPAGDAVVFNTPDGPLTGKDLRRRGF